jgi:hypothetical protein
MSRTARDDAAADGDIRPPERHSDTCDSGGRLTLSPRNTEEIISRNSTSIQFFKIDCPKHFKHNEMSPFLSTFFNQVGISFTAQMTGMHQA